MFPNYCYCVCGEIHWRSRHLGEAARAHWSWWRCLIYNFRESRD